MWRAVLDNCADSRLIHHTLAGAELASLEGGRATLTPVSTGRAWLEGHAPQIAELLRTATGETFQVVIDAGEPSAQESNGTGPPAAPEPQEQPEVLSHPLVQQTMRAFGARVVQVRTKDVPPSADQE